MFFISFSPGFNRVTPAYLVSKNRFNGLPRPANSKTVKTVRTSKATWFTRLKPGENEMNLRFQDASLSRSIPQDTDNDLINVLDRNELKTILQQNDQSAIGNRQLATPRNLVCFASTPKVMKNVISRCGIVLVLLWATTTICAQSIDLNFPSPVRTNEVLGKIAARDLGDARLTDHFYAFAGIPGDVLITIQSTNLNGDVDVFTAGSLRPLLKFILYAESTSPTTKSIYLRRREELILRVEARSPNDDEGVYQIRFGGSFEPVVGGPEVSESVTGTTGTPSVASRGKKTRRVSSVGARIEEPTPPASEVAAAPTPEPTPVDATPPKAAKESPTVAETPKKAPARNARARRPAARRATSPISSKPKATAANKTKDNAEPTGTAEPEPVTTAPTRSSTRRGTKSAKAAKPPQEPETDSGPRLIIETNGGKLIDRSMNSVRRVTVENGQVVVVGKDGKIDRIQLVNIVRMSIQP